jgi:hypothetical protein
MKKIKLLSILLVVASFQLKAQLSFCGFVDAGYAGSAIKTDEFPIFLNSYNNYQTGLSQKFDVKPGMAHGKYINFGIGIGGKAKFTIAFGRYLVQTPHMEARYTNGEGRDLWVELKDASTETGMRFDLGRFTTGFQFDMELRTVSVYSQYVFPDDSRSFGFDHTLNGVFSNNRLQVGVGANIGFRVLPHLYLVAKCDYIFQTDKSHPEYHQYEDLQDFKTFTPDYLPRDMAEYINNPFNSTENSISNDVRGLRFGFGIQFMFATNEDE